jgi:hypothetical protein
MTQQPDVAIWILTAVVGALGMILWWSIRLWVKSITEKIAEMMAELKIVGKQNIGFEKDISRLDRSHDSHDKRMQDYSERIRNLELKQPARRNRATK